MKILGIGVDIINNKRIKFSIRKKDFIKEFFLKMKLNFQKKLKQKLIILQKDLLLKRPYQKL